MFLQCMEGQRPDNVHSLGLTPASYVPDADRKMGSESWDGEDKLIRIVTLE